MMVSGLFVFAFFVAAVDAAKIVSVSLVGVRNPFLNVEALTAVAIDTCSLKGCLNFSDAALINLTKALGPGVLRIGGTDQKKYSYDMDSNVECLSCACGDSGVMTKAYWESILDFCIRTNRSLVFGLATENDDAMNNATALLATSVHEKAIKAYTFGNEQSDDPDDQGAKLSKLKQAFPTAQFWAPDSAIGPIHDYTEPFIVGDETAIHHLHYFANYTHRNKHTLDGASFHEYDFRAYAINATDRESLYWPPDQKNFSRFYNVHYLTLWDRMLDRVEALVPVDLPLYLTETDSVNHHGVHNVTDSFANSLWLAFRLGRASRRPRLRLMARQTLVGYQYALLQNQSASIWFPTVDYFTTKLFRLLLDSAISAIDMHSSDSLHLSAFGFRRSDYGFVLLLISHHDSEAIDITLQDLFLIENGQTTSSISQPRFDYILAPNYQGDSSDPAPYKITSATATLNGVELSDPYVNLTALAASSNYNDTIHLEPLTFGFFHFSSSLQLRTQIVS